VAQYNIAAVACIRPLSNSETIFIVIGLR